MVNRFRPRKRIMKRCALASHRDWPTGKVRRFRGPHELQQQQELAILTQATCR